MSNTCCSNTARVSNNHVTFRQISSFFFYDWVCMMSSRMDICMFTRSDRGWTDWLNDQDGIKDYVELWIMQSCSRRVQEENTEVEMSNFKMRVTVRSVGLKSVPSFCLIPPSPRVFTTGVCVCRLPREQQNEAFLNPIQLSCMRLFLIKGKT